MKNTSNSFIILIVGLGKLSAQDNRMTTDITTMMMPNVCSWPEASRMAVKEIKDKYGKPDGGYKRRTYRVEERLV